MEKKPDIYITKDEILSFFKAKNLKYLKRTRVDWKPLLSKNLSNSPYYKENIELFEDLNVNYSENIKKSEIAPIYIKKIDDKVGYGVFAADNIKKKSFIGEYTGVVRVSDSDSGEKEINGGFDTDYTWYYLDEIEGGPVLEINGMFEGNEMRFLNHSKYSNVDVEHTLHNNQWIIFFVASMNIRKDDQLLISYGEEYWEGDCRDFSDI